MNVPAHPTTEAPKSRPPRFGSVEEIADLVEAETILVRIAAHAHRDGEVLFADTLREATRRCSEAIEALYVRKLERPHAAPLRERVGVSS